jgi:uncharacterized protein (DUF2141 family)
LVIVCPSPPHPLRLLETTTMSIITRIAAAIVLAALGTTVVLANEPTQSAPISAPAPAVGTYTLTVTVEGVRSAAGTIQAGLLKADATAGTARQAGGTGAAAAPGTLVLTFPGLSAGEYAVQLFHDENGDGQMGTNLFGIPTEGFGFSNAARASFGPPKFADMKVVVSADTTTRAVLAY